MWIQELETRTGLDRATIRYYEKEGLLRPRRLENGYREYSSSDAQQLMKISLLRQLGMSLIQIKALQQGTADFEGALAAQIQVLNRRIEENRQARAVCQRLYEDRVQYADLDPAHYLRLLREIPAEQPARKFREYVPREVHPWRRFFARYLDATLFSVVICLILFTAFRLRPLPLGMVQTLFAIGIGLLFIPLEALMLSRWGTTPGKFVLGISLETAQGGKPSFRDALSRSWSVFRSGEGCKIPYIDIFCHIKSYRILMGKSKNQDFLSWDDGFELQYTQPRNAFLALLIAGLVLGISVTTLDCIKPHYRGDHLTVAQFARNYNDTRSLLQGQYLQTDTLDSNGKRETLPNQMTVHLGGTPENERYEFEYSLQQGRLEQIRYQNRWNELTVTVGADAECFRAAVTVLLSQEGCGIWELLEFQSLWKSQLQQQTAEFSYKNLHFLWEVSIENGSYQYRDDLGAYLEHDGTSGSDFAAAEVRFVMDILDD